MKDDVDEIFCFHIQRDNPSLHYSGRYVAQQIRQDVGRNRDRFRVQGQVSEKFKTRVKFSLPHPPPLSKKSISCQNNFSKM